MDGQFAFTLSIFLHNGTFLKGQHNEYLGEWFLVNVREMCFYNNSDSENQTSSSEGCVSCTSGSAIGVLGKLILQVADSLLLRQNCGLQILNLLQQPLKQLRLERRRGEKRGEIRETEEERNKDSDREGKIKDKEK